MLVLGALADYLLSLALCTVGVGRTFLAHALGHIACRRGATVLAVRTEQMLKTLKHARLHNSYETELRKLIAVDLLILDDFAIDVLDPVESRDLYDLLLARYRTGSVIVTSNRGLVTFADLVRAQSRRSRFADLVRAQSRRSRRDDGVRSRRRRPEDQVLPV